MTAGRFAASLLAALLAVGSGSAAAAVQAPQEDVEPPAAGADAEPVFGKRSTWSLGSSERRVPVARGAALFAQPHRRSEVLDRFDRDAEIELLEERGGWARVTWGSWRGWVPLRPGAENLGSPMPSPAGARSDERRLARLRERAGAALAERSLGPFTLWTDVDDEPLLAELATLAAALPAVYESRYGVGAGEPAGEIVVLFAREEDYRAYARSELGASAADRRGETGFRLESAECCRILISATYVGESTRDELRQALVHELVHLLNRRAFGPSLPLWLEEGLAEDLSYGAVDAAGALDPNGLGGRTEDRSRRLTIRSSRTWQAVEVSGPRAALHALVEGWHRPQCPALDELARLPSRAAPFLADATLAYAKAGFLVRFLLSGPEGRASRFLRLLAAIADGDRQGDEGVEALLGAAPRRLENDLYPWLLALARAHGVPVPGEE